MKRQYFDISLNGSVVATTFAWNAAIRTIERLVRERARLAAVEGEKDAVYKLVESHRGAEQVALHTRTPDLAICS